MILFVKKNKKNLHFYVCFVNLGNSNRYNMEKLTIQEEEAMLAVWKINGGFIKDILDKMQEEMPYTTLASTVKKLEKKGYVKGVRYANAIMYVPAISQEDYKSKFMNSFVDEYFGNSYKEMVSFFAKERKLNEDELKEIIDLIEKG